MQAEIITIGDEILIGQIVDTNSAWLGEKLNAAGIQIHRITSVSDTARHIEMCIRDSLRPTGCGQISAAGQGDCRNCAYA